MLIAAHRQDADAQRFCQNTRKLMMLPFLPAAVMQAIVDAYENAIDDKRQSLCDCTAEQHLLSCQYISATSRQMTTYQVTYLRFDCELAVVFIAR